MPRKFVRESWNEEVIEYSLYFKTSRTGGFSFPCDFYGNVDTSILAEPGLENYKACVSGLIETIGEPEIRDHRYYIHHPAVIECTCGKEVELRTDSEGIAYCDCGQMYNGSGQQLAPRSQWEQNISGGWDYDEY